MSFEADLAVLLSQPWGERACRGYTILALERCGYQPAEISRVLAELHEVFAFTSPQEAPAHYCLFYTSSRKQKLLGGFHHAYHLEDRRTPLCPGLLCPCRCGGAGSRPVQRAAGSPGRDLYDVRPVRVVHPCLLYTSTRPEDLKNEPGA